MTGHVAWGTLPSWQQLDLSEMLKFTFQPQVHSLGEGLDTVGGEDAITGWAADAVAAVLKKCGDSVEKISYNGCCPMQWPGNEVIPLPKPRNLTLNAGCIRASNLRLWMAQMPSLDHLGLNGSRLHQRDKYRSWLDVFDAIRDHPNRLHIQFDQIQANSVSELSFRKYHTGDFERVLKQRPADDPWEDIDRSLALYLSGKIGYNEYKDVAG